MNPYVIAHRGRLFLFFWPFTRYIVTQLTVAAGWFVFKVLNKTVIIGDENVGTEMNTVLLSNHQTMIDGFLVGYGAYFPKSLWKPSLLPWHPAAQENFWFNPLIAWLSDNWKCIPVKAGRKDFGAMKRMESCLRSGVMTVFPEGTRSRDGKLLPPRSGIGYVMLKTRPKAVPVCMDGMDAVLPVGSFLPRIGNTVFLYYGRAVDLSEFSGVEPSRETAQACIEKVFMSIHRQQRILARYRRYRRRLLERRNVLFRIYRP